MCSRMPPGNQTFGSLSLSLRKSLRHCCANFLAAFSVLAPNDRLHGRLYCAGADSRGSLAPSCCLYENCQKEQLPYYAH